MNLKQLESSFLNKQGTERETPFGEEYWVYKVMGKMFGLISWQDDPVNINLKCDPDLAQNLRATYEAVNPGYHMNKEHWNTVTIDNSIPDGEIVKMIDHSYDLVVKKLKKSDREKLKLEMK